MFGNNRQISRDTLYQLKYRYGNLVYVRHPISNAIDVTTGKMLRRYTVTKIGRAVVLPSEMIRTAVYDLTYIASNKNFGYGGLFEKNSVVVIIYHKDMKTPIDSTSHLVIKTRRYEIAKIDNTDDNYTIAAKMVESSAPILDPEGD